MTIQEETALKDLFRKVKRPMFTSYAVKRIQQRHVDLDRILNTIKFGELIEFHVKENSFRVLIRESRPKRKQATCVVLELFTHKVITVFTNSEYDRHWNLDSSIYNKHLDIIKILRSGGRNV